MGSIELKQCITAKVGLIPRDICARPNTFELLTVRRQSRGDSNSLTAQCRDTMTTSRWVCLAYLPGPQTIYRWLSARLQYLQCVSNGDTAVLRWAIDIKKTTFHSCYRVYRIVYAADNISQRCLSKAQVIPWHAYDNFRNISLITKVLILCEFLLNVVQ